MRAVLLTALLIGTVPGALPGGAAPPSATPEPPADGHDWLSVSAYLDRTALVRGEPFRLAVVLDLAPGFHVNANPPSLDFLVPTRLVPQAHPALRWGEVQYPPGEALAAEWAGPTPIRVYAGRTVLVVDGTVSPEAPLGPTILRLTLSYQGCAASTCYPPATRTVQVKARVVPAGTQAGPAYRDLFAAATPPTEAASPPPPAAGRAAPTGAGRPVPAAAERPTPTGPLPDLAPSADLRFEGEADVAGWRRRGLAVYLGLLYLGGLALNLTPCVFPLIPVTMNLFAAQGESRPRKVLPLALAYVVGLALAFTAVGVAASLAGRSLGLVLQSPWGVLGVVVVLATMMASALGAFEIRLPSGLAGRLGGRRGLVGALAMGAVMGGVATPCVGPFLVALVTFVAARGSVALGAVSFFATGIGLGTPYVFLGLFTSLVNRFPRSGGWLLWTKRAMAMTLAGLILYFLWPFIALPMRGPMTLGLFLFAALYLGWLEGRSRRPFSRRFLAVRLATAAALVAAGFWTYAQVAHPAGPGGPSARAPLGHPAQGARPATPHTPGAGAGPTAPEAGTPQAPPPQEKIRWTAWRPGALQEARRAGRGVLLYFGADWCIECRAWKARVFSRPPVVEASRALRAVYVDLTEAPTGPKAAFAEAWRARNPPAVFVLDGRGRVVKAWRSPPAVEAVVAALRAAASP